MDNCVKTMQLTMDTTHMASGRYIADIVAYIYDEFGNEQFLDGVFPGMVLEIEDKVDKNNELVWLHQYWGHTRYHDLVVK